MEQTFMKEKPILPLVLTMSLPMVLSMLVSSLYNIVDSYFVAQIDENAMLALSLVYPIQILITAVGVGFGIGINAVTAFFLGAQNTDSADKAVSQGIILSGIHGILMTLLCLWGMPHFLHIFTSDSTVIEYSLRYSNIIFMFSTTTTISVAFEKIFQSVGKMNVSMFSMISGCVINIVLDPLMIFGVGFFPRLEIQGAAIATGIAQISTLAIYLIYFLKIKLPVHFTMNHKIWSEPVYKRIYAIGIPATLNMALSSLLITALNGILSGFSQSYVLILGIYYKLQTFIYLTANGIVQGIRPLIGYNYGAGRQDRVRAIHRIALILGTMVMAFGTMLCLFIPGQIMGIFTTQPDTIIAGSTALRIICCGFILSTISVMASGTFEGLGKGIPSLIVSIIRYIVIIPIALIFSQIFGAVGVWHAFWFTELLAAILSAIMLHRYLK